jgi:hypothetical protein
MPDSEPIRSFEHFDQLLDLEYERFVQGIPDRSDEWVRRRFSVYGIFPQRGWELLQFAYKQALASDDAAPLLEATWRFTRCAHAAYGHDDEMTIGAGGYDHCRLVFPALFTLLQDDRYLRSAFHDRRLMSKGGYPAYVHGVNVLVSLLNRGWTHTEKSLERARRFMQAKSAKHIDKHFVGIFLGCLDRDASLVASSITGLHAGYDRSDWGRHKPGTLSLLMKSLLDFAGDYVPMVATTLPGRLFTAKEIGLFQKLDAARVHFDARSRGFAPPLEFLNPLEVGR